MNRKRRRRQSSAGRRSGAVGRAGSAKLNALMETAVTHHESGQLVEAERAYRQLLGVARHPDVLHLLGVLQHQRGETHEAIALINEALAIAPKQAAYHYNLAEAYRAAGNLAEAVRGYRHAIDLEPRFADAHFNLGNAFFEHGDLPAAAACYRRARELAPDDHEIALNLGNALLELGDPQSALELFQFVETKTPGDTGARINLGTALVVLGRLAVGLETFRAVVGSAPAGEKFEIELAIGSILLDHGHAPAAIAFLEPAAARDRDSEEGQALFARALQECGRFDEATAHFNRALDINPTLATAHLGIVNSRKLVPGDPAIGRLEQALGDTSIDTDTRSSLLFGLAKIHDDLGQTDDAFSACLEANRLRRQSVPYDTAAFSDEIDKLTRLFTRAFFAERADFGFASERPVLIIGMPRSGSTLIEQMMAAHSKVYAGGERTELRNAIYGLPLRPGIGDTTFPNSVAAIDRPLSRDLGAQIDGVYANLAPDAARFTDKMPSNMVRLAFVALALPDAHIIHCKRDPIDTCLSCFFQDFDRRQAFSYDLIDLGRYYRAYERLIAHWRKVLPRPILDVTYENLTANPEQECRRILTHCGLEWEDQCLAFHEAKRSVSTASVWQVRQPIYRSSVQKWRRYEAHLGPLFDALGMEAVSSDGAPA